MNNNIKWWLRKGGLLFFLLSQFYLAKKFGEPYPCIILPGFAQAYPLEQLPTASTYTFLLVKGTEVDTLQMDQLFPFVPPNYWAFTAAHLFELTAEEEREWQGLLINQWSDSSPTILQMEHWINTWEGGAGTHVSNRSRAAVREIAIGDGRAE